MKKNSRRSPVETARRLANGWWGSRYADYLAKESGLVVKDAAIALAASLAQVIPRIHTVSPLLILPTLTRAIVAALFKDSPPARAAFDRLLQKEDAMEAFAQRVCARTEEFLEDCLTLEFLWFFLGEGPGGPRKAAQAESVRFRTGAG